LNSDPPGPAIPVTDTARLAVERFSAPSAIWRAISSDTAPLSARVSGRMPSMSILAAFE
jgi:hypothetical protein